MPFLALSLLLILMSLPAVPNRFLNLILPVARAATSFTVNSTGDGADSNLADGVCNDGTGACTLRAAIQQANAAGGDSINFSLTAGSTITLTGGELLIDKGLSISGPGAQLLTVSGNNASRVFRVTSVTSVVISGLTISGGRALGAGGIFNDGGTLNINSCSISNNNATTGVGGGISNGTGAEQAGVLTINNSTISHNTAGNGGGGLFQIAGAVLSNTTISNNNTGGSGGGINNANPATLINVTISGNSASNTGGGIYNPGIGILTFKNTLIGGNISPSGPDCFGANFVSQDHNLIGNTSGVQIVGTTTHNIINVNAFLGPLAANGGPTLTHALLPGSPAIETGSNANLPPDTFDLDGDVNTSEPIPFDQRGTGFNRTAEGNGDGNSTVDIGAFEVQSILVTNTADSGPGSLRQAITDANALAITDAINFQAGLTGAIALSSALPDLSTSIAINGPGMRER
jgi:CSLREA domain-containing protein